MDKASQLIHSGLSPAAESAANERLRLYYQPRPAENTREEILTGLTANPRRIAPKFFYDSKGAALFDQITRLPEYYLSRVERQIFRQHSKDMAQTVGRGRVLIEPGSGSSEKVTMLLDAFRPAAYVPLEITESHLLRASHQLVMQYPWLSVHGICADYSSNIPLPDTLPDAPRLLFFPGSTIGNFEPTAARIFLGHLHDACGDDGALLIGVDLRKKSNILNAAYNDSAHVTAQFNLNILDHTNHLADGNFNRDFFRHLAFFNDDESRVEMHLESLESQTVTVAETPLYLEAGERIHTENSYKYSVESFQAMAAEAGFKPRRFWVDPAGWFSVHLLDAA